MGVCEIYHAHDVGELESIMEPEWPMECLQVKSGKFEYLDLCIDLEGLRIFWPQVNQTIRVKQTRLGNGCCFSVPVSLSDFIHVDCQEISTESGVLLQSGMELDFLIPKNTHILTIDINLTLIPLDLPKNIHHPVAVIDKQAKKELLNYCQFVTKTVQQQAPAYLANSKSYLRHFRHGVVSRLTRALTVYSPPPQSSTMAKANDNKLLTTRITNF